MEHLKIVELKDCPSSGQKVANKPVTEEKPSPADDWHAVEADECEPGLYRAVMITTPDAPDAREVLEGAIIDEVFDPSGLLDTVPKDCVNQLERALKDAVSHLTYYVEDDFLVRVPSRHVPAGDRNTEPCEMCAKPATVQFRDFNDGGQSAYSFRCEEHRATFVEHASETGAVVHGWRAVLVHNGSTPETDPEPSHITLVRVADDEWVAYPLTDEERFAHDHGTSAESPRKAIEAMADECDCEATEILEPGKLSRGQLVVAERARTMEWCAAALDDLAEMHSSASKNAGLAGKEELALESFASMSALKEASKWIRDQNPGYEKHSDKWRAAELVDEAARSFASGKYHAGMYTVVGILTSLADRIRAIRGGQ